MLSNAYFLVNFRFDTAENQPAKNLQIFAKKLLILGGGRSGEGRRALREAPRRGVLRAGGPDLRQPRGRRQVRELRQLALLIAHDVQRLVFTRIQNWVNSGEIPAKFGPTLAKF